METIRLIETYLDGNLEGRELEEFHARQKQDIDFAHEVLLHTEVNESIMDDDIADLRMELRKLIPEPRQKSKKFIRYISVAAAVFIGILTIFRISNGPEYTGAFNNFYTPYETDFSTRSVGTNLTDINIAYLHYQKGEYQIAFELLSNNNTAVFNNSTAQFYRGVCAIELEKYDVAEESLLKVASNKDSLYYLHANWYLSLLYLKTNHPEKAKNHLLSLAEEENFYAQNARKILKKYY